MLNVALPTDEDRELLRESLRGWLGEHWPAATATSDAADPARLRTVWRGLAQQRLGALGRDPAEGGLQEGREGDGWSGPREAENYRRQEQGARRPAPVRGVSGRDSSP